MSEEVISDPKWNETYAYPTSGRRMGNVEIPGNRPTILGPYQDLGGKAQNPTNVSIAPNITPTGQGAAVDALVLLFLNQMNHMLQSAQGVPLTTY